MANKSIPWLLLVLVLALAPPLSAQEEGNVCDEIDAVAGAWDEIAAALDESAAEGLSKADAEEFAALIDEGAGHTRELAEALVGSGAEQERQLGGELARALDALAAARGAEATVGAIDGVIETLDRIVEACEAEQAAAPQPAGTIAVAYQPTQRWGPLAEALSGSGVFEGIAETVAAVVALPADLEVTFTECGEPNAFYVDRQVTMCYEFFDLFVAAFSQTGTPAEEMFEKVLGVGAFFYLHELGHALVDLLELPITGREEDSVDNLATLILLSGDGESALFSAIENFGAMADMTAGEGEFAFWDEHSLDAQRLYDVACLIFGSDPEAYGEMVGPDGLPAERAARCAAEYEQKDRAWDALLAPHYRDAS